ncbi:hypothetical protein D3C71_979680 [compost metagenome]
MQPAIIVGEGNLFRVVAKIAQPVEIVGFEKGETREPLVFVVLKSQMLHGIDLFTDRISVNTEQVITTAAEFSRYLYIIVMVKNGLLHMQFIRIGIQQCMQNRGSELSHRCAVASSHGSV